MRRLLQTSLLLAGLLGLNVAHADPVTINFDGLAGNTVVTNQFSEATFSSKEGFDILTVSRYFGSSRPNFICTGTSTKGIDCVQDVFVSFTNPVKDLSFLFIGDDTAGQKGFVDVFGASDILLGTVTMTGDGKGSTPKLVDLSAFSDVGRINIRNVTDQFGIGFDDFTFSTAAVAVAVPEPASLALVGLGLAVAGLSRRRARSSHTRLPRL